MDTPTKYPLVTGALYHDRLFIGPLPENWEPMRVVDGVDAIVCAYCGGPSNKVSSGVSNCWRCWNWRKLDGPAARHWLKVSGEFLSNVDPYDYMTFMPKRVGLEQDEFDDVIKAAHKIYDRCYDMMVERSEEVPAYPFIYRHNDVRQDLEE